MWRWEGEMLHLLQDGCKAIGRRAGRSRVAAPLLGSMEKQDVEEQTAARLLCKSSRSDSAYRRLQTLAWGQIWAVQVDRLEKSC